MTRIIDDEALETLLGVVDEWIEDQLDFIKDSEVAGDDFRETLDDVKKVNEAIRKVKPGSAEGWDFYIQTMEETS